VQQEGDTGGAATRPRDKEDVSPNKASRKEARVRQGGSMEQSDPQSVPQSAPQKSDPTALQGAFNAAE
jgi:hypothetical protein